MGKSWGSVDGDFLDADADRHPQRLPVPSRDLNEREVKVDPA
jgi:hypothetical protein